MGSRNDPQFLLDAVFIIPLATLLHKSNSILLYTIFELDVDFLKVLSNNLSLPCGVRLTLLTLGDPKSRIDETTERRNDGMVEWRNHGTAENHPKS